MEHRRSNPSRSELIERYRLDTSTSPRIRMNFVMSADGAATASGVSGSLGGETDRLAMRVLRTLADVLIVGAGTVRVEGYGGLGLDAEAVEWRREQGLTPHPRLVIITDGMHLDPQMTVFTQAEVRPLVVTNETSPEEQVRALSDVADVVRVGEHHVDLPAMTDMLCELGHRHLLCEGGPHLFGSLLQADLVDELCLTLAPRLIAGHATRIAVSDEELFRNVRLIHAIPDAEGFLLLRYERATGLDQR